jgi:hypothetical protein
MLIGSVDCGQPRNLVYGAAGLVAAAGTGLILFGGYRLARVRTCPCIISVHMAH